MAVDRNDPSQVASRITELVNKMMSVPPDMARPHGGLSMEEVTELTELRTQQAALERNRAAGQLQGPMAPTGRTPTARSGPPPDIGALLGAPPMAAQQPATPGTPAPVPPPGTPPADIGALLGGPSSRPPGGVDPAGAPTRPLPPSNPPVPSGRSRYVDVGSMMGEGPTPTGPPDEPPSGGGDDWSEILWGMSSGLRGRLGKAGRTAARAMAGGHDYVEGARKVRELEQSMAANPQGPPGAPGSPGAGTASGSAELAKAKAQMAGGQEMMAQAAGQAIQMMVEKMVEGYKDMGKGAQKAFASGDAGGERIEGFGQFTKGFGAAMGPANPLGMGLETIGAFIEKTGEAAKVLQDWIKGLHEANIRFADFSGSMASVKANQEIRQFELDRQRGDRRAGSAEELVKSMHDMNVQWARLEDNIANHLNKLGAHLADLVEYVLKILNKLLHSEEKELPGGGYLTDEMTYLRDLRMAEGFGRPPHMGMP